MSDVENAGGDAQPVSGTPLTPAQLAALAALSGSISVEIDLPDGTKYNLSVSVPTSAGEAYTFDLTETPASSGASPETLADFKFKDANNFSVVVNFPPLSIQGGPKISGGFTLSAGTTDTPAISA